MPKEPEVQGPVRASLNTWRLCYKLQKDTCGILVLMCLWKRQSVCLLLDGCGFHSAVLALTTTLGSFDFKNKW